jgi:D-arabinose 1-dehydrogenase-like Zn-dependent alcohol dehydrogenase
VIVAPATGPFGLAAVKVALAMGARVIAMGRNAEVLKRLGQDERIKMVQISGNVEKDLKALKEFGTCVFRHLASGCCFFYSGAKSLNTPRY